MYFPRLVEVRAVLLAYDEISLLAEIAGYTSLFLGVSLIQVMEDTLSFRPGQWIKKLKIGFS